MLDTEYMAVIITAEHDIDASDISHRCEIECDTLYFDNSNNNTINIASNS